MDKRALILVGNGFNHFAKGYIGNKKYQKEIVEKWKACSRKRGKWPDGELEKHLKELENSMSQYCDLLKFLELRNYDINGETLLTELEKFITNLDEGDASLKKTTNTDIIEGLEKLIKKKIKNTIREIIQGKSVENYAFLKYHNAMVKFAFADTNNNYFAKLLNDIIGSHIKEKRYSVFTTNYDYIAYSVFKEKWSNTSVEGVNVYHLHGYFGNNDYGELICCAPKSKKGRIDKNEKNAKNFRCFEEELKDANVIILFGIGLTSDPHILKELNRKSKCVFIIVDFDKDSYMKNNYFSKTNKFSFLSKNDIYFIDTKGFAFKNTDIAPGICKMKKCASKKIETPEQLLASLRIVFEDIAKK